MVRIKSDRPASRNSGKSSVGQKPAPADTLTGGELVRSLRLSDEELRELGLLDRDQLIISIPPESPKKKTEG